MKKVSLILIVAVVLFAQPVPAQRPFGAPGSLQPAAKVLRWAVAVSQGENRR